MKVILYSAISIDGFIATNDGNSDWVSEADLPSFKAEIQKAGCIVIGRRTFQQFTGQIYPVKNVLNIVMTRSQEKQQDYDNVIFTSNTPRQVIDIAKSKGYKSVLLVGGGHLNGSFLKEGLIDEIIVDIHPLILGEGIKIFEGVEGFHNFKKISLQALDQSLLLVKYKLL